MIDIVVFGKPRSFESYEYYFDRDTKVKNPENSHQEPSIKPTESTDVPILHYNAKNGVLTWEVYKYCHGYQSARNGIVLGVGLKSDKDFSLTHTRETILQPFWEDFANALLDRNRKFKTESIVTILKDKTTWTPEDKQNIKSSINGNGTSIPSVDNNDTVLLVAPDLDEISTVETEIKAKKNVYIASDESVFRHLCNQDILQKEANNQIHIIKEGKIQKKQESKPVSKDKQKWYHKLGWSKTTADPPVASPQKGSNGDDNTGSQGNGNGKDGVNRKFLYAAALVSIIIIAVLFFIFKPKPADRIEFAEAPETGCITSDFNLSPKLLHGNSERTSTKLTDIVWTVEGDGSNYIVFDTINHSITFSDEYYIKKPKNELPLTITAKLNDSELGRVSYTLEKYKLPQADKVLMKPCTKAIKTEWNMAPILSCKGSKDVSTTLADIEFVPEPIGIVEIENGKLKVKKPAEKEISVTIKAFLNGTLLGEQIYKIDKKEIQEPIAIQPKVKIDGKILCNTKIYQAKYDEYTNKTTFSKNDNITTYAFLAVDSQNNQFKAGGWICPTGITFKDKTQNPATLNSEPSPGKYTLKYQVDNTVRAQITITITE